MPENSSPKYFLEKLCSLPHRGTGSVYEKKAAGLIFQEYKKLGLKPEMQRCRIVKNGWFLQPLTYSFFILSTTSILLDKLILSLIFFAVGALLLGLNHFRYFGLFKRIYPGESQNVFVELPSRKGKKKTVVVIGHYDSPRCTIGIKLLNPLAKSLAPKARSFPPFLNGPFFISNFSVLLNLLLFFLSPVPMTRLLVGSYVVVTLLITVALTLHTFFSPFVPGAFDNGSGAAVVMALAPHFSKNRLETTGLVFLNTGSEENITNGLETFLEESRLDPKTTCFIDLDGVGADILTVSEGEISGPGLFVPFDKELFSLVRELVRKNKRFQKIKEFCLPVPSECSLLVKEGFRVAVMMNSINEIGYVAQYHQMLDTIDKINFETLDLCRDFTTEVIKEIDRRDS